MTDHRSDLAHAYDHAAAVLAGVDATRLGSPTPCPAYDVAGLVDHLVGAARRVVSLGRGETPAGEEFPHVELADAPHLVERAGKEAADAWADDATLSRRTTMPWGEEYTGETLVDMYLAELVTHTWDLQTATGQPVTADPSLASAALDAARDMLKDEYRTPAGEVFGPEVEAPAGAGDYDRLAAFMGRTPGAGA